MVSIKKASINDAVIIALLGRVTFSDTFSACFRDQQDLLDYLSGTFEVQKLRLSLENTNNIYWIAYENELPIGFAKLKIVSSSPLFPNQITSQLQKIYVLRDFHDKKVGYLLLKEIENTYATLDSTHLWLSVLKSNEKAIKFYVKNHFEHVGEHKFTIGKESLDFFVYSN